MNRPLSNRKASWVIALVVLIGLGTAVAVWALRSPELPSPTSDVVALAKFVRTEQYKKLPEADKRPYMKTLRRSSDALAAAHRAGQISDKEYQAAYLNGWFERKLDDMEEFYSTPADKRAQMLVREHVKKVKESAAKAPASKPASALPEPPKPNDELEDDFVEDRVETWPPEERAKWEEYRKAAKAAKEAAKTKG